MLCVVIVGSWGVVVVVRGGARAVKMEGVVV